MSDLDEMLKTDTNFTNNANISDMVRPKLTI